ncbi:Uncharacterised protein [Streptococcus pneumoniae]|nr:Uncharacterised protein [Streptococcus pneumoniae]
MITCHIMIDGRVEPLPITLPAVPTIVLSLLSQQTINLSITW